VPPAGVGEPANPLQAEMRALTKVVQLAIVAVANDQLSLIPPAFAQLHGAREKTQSALEAGAFQLPQNADNVEGFVAMDDAFHEQLAGLLQAAKADDLAAASRQLGGLVQGCTSGHQSYRFP